METKILQFGEGVFLRCFFDWMVERMNAKCGFGASVRIVRPRSGGLNAAAEEINAHGGRFRVCLRGVENGERVERLEEVRCVAGADVAESAPKHALEPSLRFVVSNTTEAGIQYVRGADTFPAKVLRVLKARMEAGLPGLVFLPMELIEDNGEELKWCVLAHLADEPDERLGEYIEEECVFCSTLVDRIVSGAPSAEDAERLNAQCGEKLPVVCGEPYHFMAVRTPEGYDLESEMPFAAAGLNVKCVPDLAPYRNLKVRLLNATHTTIACKGLEEGFTEVAECVEDAKFGAFVRKVLFGEILPTVDMPDEVKLPFAESVLERFANPYAHHRLASIAMNSVAKWKARCLPVALDHYRACGKMPEALMEGYDAIARRFDRTV